MESIAILGCGKMGQVIAQALIASKDSNSAEIWVTTRSPERADELTELGLKTVPNAEAVVAAEIVVLAVKPKDMAGLLDEIQPHVNANHLVVSVAAGITTSFVESRLAKKPDAPRVIRAMPNMPARVRQGMTALAAGASAGAEDMARVTEIFAVLGETVELPEDLMDAATALSGSGPAYFAYFTQNMIEAGVKLGLDEALARKLAVQTLVGTAKLLDETDLAPQDLQRAVTSPKGTTEAAIKYLNDSGADAALKGAIKAAAKRAGKLSKS